jgi:hypothetical protein
MTLGRLSLAFFTLWLAACSGDGAKEPSGTGGGGGSAPGGSAGAGNGGATGNGGSAAVAGGGSASGGVSAGGSTGSGGTANGGSGNTGGGGPTKRVGDPCTRDSECPSVGGTTPKCMSSWPNGGSCTAIGCAGSDLQCPDGSVCGMHEGETRCLAFCNPGFKECRAGYTCSPDFSGCIPTK